MYRSGKHKRRIFSSTRAFLRTLRAEVSLPCSLLPRFSSPQWNVAWASFTMRLFWAFILLEVRVSDQVVLLGVGTKNNKIVVNQHPCFRNKASFTWLSRRLWSCSHISWLAFGGSDRKEAVTPHESHSNGRSFGEVWQMRDFTLVLDSTNVPSRISPVDDAVQVPDAKGCQTSINVFDGAWLEMSAVERPHLEKKIIPNVLWPYWRN